MELALAVLLVSCFTCVGLLSLWAATSQRHWFVRAGVFLAAISLTLLIPAHEVFVGFALQGSTVAASCCIARRMAQRESQAPRRFSLATLLQVIVLVSIATAVGAKLPVLNRLAWQSVATIGICTGLAVLVSFWIVKGRSLNWWKRLAAGVLLTFCISLPLVFCDWFVLSVTSVRVWPPEPNPNFNFMAMYGGYGEDDPITVWAPIVATVVSATSLVVWLLAWVLAGSWDAKKPARRPWQDGLKRFALLVLAVILLAPTAVVYYLLMTPLPIPKQTLPDDNGYNDLLAAGRSAESSKFETAYFDAETATLKALRAAVQEIEPAFTGLQVGLAKEVKAPIDYNSLEGLGLPEVQSLRALARCINGRAILATREGRIDDALRDHLDTGRLGYAIRPGTLQVNGLVGAAISGIGRWGINDLRTKLDAEQAMMVINTLQQLESECEPVESFIYRDRVWGQHALGWHGHLTEIIREYFADGNRSSNIWFREAMRQEQAVSRLLCTELAIRMFRETQDELPITLSELVPQYLSAVPSDPYDDEGRPLLYRQENDGYVLYCIGSNAVDDGGIIPADVEEPRFWHMYDGDLSLEYFFAPDPAVETDDELIENAENDND